MLIKWNCPSPCGTAICRRITYNALLRPAQLNCLADLYVKREIWRLEPHALPAQAAFPLAVFVGAAKLTTDTLEGLWFAAHIVLAEQTFFQLGLGIMSSHSFQEVAWRQVYDALQLHTVPRLFQFWACKQAMEVAGTNLMQLAYKDAHDPHCPSPPPPRLGIVQSHSALH